MLPEYSGQTHTRQTPYTPCRHTRGQCPHAGRRGTGTGTSAHRVGPSRLHRDIVLLVSGLCLLVPGLCLDGGGPLNGRSSTDSPGVSWSFLLVGAAAFVAADTSLSSKHRLFLPVSIGWGSGKRLCRELGYRKISRKTFRCCSIQRHVFFNT